MADSVDVLHPDVVYPALDKPATELERLVVEYLQYACGDRGPTEMQRAMDPKFCDLYDHAKHRRLIP